MTVTLACLQPGIWEAVEGDDAMNVRKLINEWCRVDVQKVSKGGRDGCGCQGVFLGVCVCAGVAFTEKSPYFTDKYQALRIYTKPVRFVLRKNLAQESTCQKDETESETGRLQKKEKEKKEGPSNDKLFEGTSQYADTWRDLYIIFDCSCFTSLGCLLPRPWGGIWL